MTLYAIRHKETGLFMPLLKRNRGYSHWNPPELLKNIDTGVPRLLTTRKKAQQCISQWFTFPNGKRGVSQSHDGEWDDIVDFKPDGRKKEDLEIIQLELR